jgi:hypothetical protein
MKNWPKVFAGLKRGRDWSDDWQPYCLVPRSSDGAWIAIGRGYKVLGAAQDVSGWSNWNAPDTVAWEFRSSGDVAAIQNVWIEGPVWKDIGGNVRWYLPFSARDYGARVGRLIEATTNPCRYAALLLTGRRPTPARPSSARRAVSAGIPDSKPELAGSLP